MNNLSTRTLSGAVFVILVIGSILVHPLTFAGFMLLITVLGLREFYRITGTGTRLLNTTGMVTGIFLFVSVTFLAHHIWTPYNYILVLMNIPLLGLPLVLQLFSPGEKPFTSAALTAAGVLYIALPLSLLGFFYYPGFAYDTARPELLVSLFALTWINDTFAYLTGSLIGKHALCPSVSPKKTLEGSAGGAVFSLTAAALISGYVTELNLLQWLVLALTVVIAGTLGDLTESMLKRSYQLKDSGDLMPGHGGVLDRFDAMLGVAPAAFVLLSLIWSL